MRGIITDDTKTKAGKDFYDKFFFKYNDVGINAKEIVLIGEEYTFARNTKITITVDNEVIYEFIIRPDDDFLEEVSDEAISTTYYYFKEKEKQSKYFTQY
ncbi:CsgE family curli-type amyloid fiber assembly protein [Flavobacterium sp.]|uniref:CsgE family curli-type amyloid fiber assembly protein n=1 Tax=Flavobacterium sp. TaxID=239 RepID=UPI002BE9F913|nr:CsgE family curli-type amyloid fiber assembly protein [Flavobacterium sp.]HSD05998.1 CsgE family curli-type amyloid fiber assembly protein [Flavobacterium sp.]